MPHLWRFMSLLDLFYSNIAKEYSCLHICCQVYINDFDTSNQLLPLCSVMWTVHAPLYCTCELHMHTYYCTHWFPFDIHHFKCFWWCQGAMIGVFSGRKLSKVKELTSDQLLFLYEMIRQKMNKIKQTIQSSLFSFKFVFEIG